METVWDAPRPPVEMRNTWCDRLFGALKSNNLNRCASIIRRFSLGISRITLVVHYHRTRHDLQSKPCFKPRVSLTAKKTKEIRSKPYFT